MSKEYSPSEALTSSELSCLYRLGFVILYGLIIIKLPFPFRSPSSSTDQAVSISSQNTVTGLPELVEAIVLVNARVQINDNTDNEAGTSRTRKTAKKRTEMQREIALDIWRLIVNVGFDNNFTITSQPSLHVQTLLLHSFIELLPRCTIHL